MKNLSKKYNSVVMLIVVSFFLSIKLNAQNNNTPYITLVTCLGGERFTPEKTVSIRWESSMYDGTVDLTLWDRRTKLVKVIASNINANVGVYDWKIPDDFTGKDYILTIKATENPMLSIKSKGYFSVLPKISLDTVSPTQFSTSNSEEDDFYNPSMICEQTVCKIKTFRIGRLYPQPATNGTLSLDAESSENATNVKAELYSITGQKLATLWEGSLKKGASTFTMTLQDVVSGSYILYLKNNKGEIVDYNRVVVAEGQK